MHGQAVTLRLGALERGFLDSRCVGSPVSFLLLGRQRDCRHERGGGITRDSLAAMVEQLAVPVFLIDCAEHPAVTVKIGELGVPAATGLSSASRARKAGSDQFPALAAAIIRVGHVRECEFFGRRILLHLGIHQLAVGLLIPPHVTGV